MIHLEKENLSDLTKNGKVLVDFYATWCGPCQMLGQVLEEIDNDRADFEIVKVNVDTHKDIAQSFGIMSIPTIVYYNNGKIIKQQLGFVPKEVILDNFKNM